jgi:hypothetical protein
LLLAAAACLRADSAQEVVDLITEAATGLSAGRTGVFLDAFDPEMKDFAKFRESVIGLAGAGDVHCSITVLRNDGDDRERALELDWLFRIEGRDAVPTVVRRRDTVKCRLRKNGKKWRIEEIEPREFFKAG